MRYLFVVVLLAGMFCLGNAAQAQGPTSTPVPSQTPEFLFGHQILLPTAWMPPELTRIPVPYTPAPDLNPMGLNITGGRIIAETANMNRALFDVMGVTGQVLNFIIIAALLLWALFAFLGIVRRVKKVQATLVGIRMNTDEADMIGGNPYTDLAGRYLRDRSRELRDTLRTAPRRFADRTINLAGGGRPLRRMSKRKKL